MICSDRGELRSQQTDDDATDTVRVILPSNCSLLVLHPNVGSYVMCSDRGVLRSQQTYDDNSYARKGKVTSFSEATAE